MELIFIIEVNKWKGKHVGRHTEMGKYIASKCTDGYWMRMTMDKMDGNSCKVEFRTHLENNSRMLRLIRVASLKK